MIFCKSRVIFLPCKSDIVRFAHSEILFAKSNLSLGKAKYHYEVISLCLLNRTCAANRTEKPQLKVQLWFFGGEEKIFGYKIDLLSAIVDNHFVVCYNLKRN